MSRLDEMEAFVRIARAGSVSKAARDMMTAKSALSRRLSELEARLGVQLMARTTRSLRLTEAGRDFLARSERLLAALDDAEDAARSGAENLGGRLRIAAPLSFGLRHLQPLLSRYVRNHPAVDVEIDFSDRFVDLFTEEFDLAIRIGALADSSLIARKLCPIGHCVAAAPEFWDRVGRPGHPRDLAGLDALRYSNLARPDQIPFWGPKGEAGSVSPKIRLLASNGDFLTAMALDGCGYLVEPRFFVHEHLAAGRLEAVLPAYEFSSISLFVVYPPTRRLTARARALVDMLVKEFAGAPVWERPITR